MATQTIRLSERLAAMSFGEFGVFRVVAVQAERGRTFSQVEYAVQILARFMADVAAVTAQIQGRVATARRRNLETGCMTSQAEVFLGFPRGRFA